MSSFAARRAHIGKIIWAACEGRNRQMAEMWGNRKTSRERTAAVQEWTGFVERLLWQTDETDLAREIIAACCEAICPDENDPRFGGFKDYLEDDDYPRRNGLQNAFVLLSLLRVYKKFGDKLGEATCRLMRRTTEMALISSVEDYCLGQTIVGYNGPFLETACLILGGEITNNLVAKHTGMRRLSDYVDYTAYFGTLWEYNSPTYIKTSLRGICSVEAHAQDKKARFVARLAKERILLDLANHYHHGLGQMGGPYFRSYFSDIVADSASMSSWMAHLLGEVVFATEGEGDEEKLVPLGTSHFVGTWAPIVCDFDAPDQTRELLRKVPGPGEQALVARTVVHRGLSMAPIDWHEPAHTSLMHLRDLPGELLLFSLCYAPLDATVDLRDITCVRTCNAALGTSSVIAPHHTGSIGTPLHEKPFLLHYAPGNDPKEKSVHVVHRRGLPPDGSVINLHRESVGAGDDEERHGRVRGGTLQCGMSALAGVRIVNSQTNTTEWLAGWSYWSDKERIWVDGSLRDTVDLSWEPGQWLVVEDGDIYVCMSFVSSTPEAILFASIVPWHIHGPIDYGIESVFECGVRLVDSAPGGMLEAALAFCAISKEEYPDTADLFSVLHAASPQLMRRSDTELVVRGKGLDGTDLELTVTFGPLTPPPLVSSRVKVERRIGGRVCAPEKLVESPFMVSGKRPLSLGESSVSGGETPVTLSQSPDAQTWCLYQPLSYAVPVEWQVAGGVVRCDAMPRGNLIYDRKEDALLVDVLDETPEISLDDFATPPAIKPLHAGD